MYNDGSLNDVSNHLVVVEDVPEVSKSFRAVLDKEKEIVTSSEQHLEENKICIEQRNEVTRKSKSEPIVKFQHLEDKDGLSSMDFDGALGMEGASIGIWIRSPACKSGGIPSNVRKFLL